MKTVYQQVTAATKQKYRQGTLLIKKHEVDVFFGNRKIGTSPTVKGAKDAYDAWISQQQKKAEDDMLPNEKEQRTKDFKKALGSSMLRTIYQVAAGEFPKEKAKPLFKELSEIELRFQQLRSALAETGAPASIRSEVVRGWRSRMLTYKADLEKLIKRAEDLIDKSSKLGI